VRQQAYFVNKNKTNKEDKSIFRHKNHRNISFT